MAIKTYWNNEGKYQNEVNELNKLTPDFNYTDNKYMNLFLCVNSVYYDVYNNGGGNIDTCYRSDIENHIIPLIEEFKDGQDFIIKCLYHNNYNKIKLEKLVNETIEIIKDKDLDYTKYTIYQDYDNSKLSYEAIEGYQKIVFADKKEYDSWIEIRTSESWGFTFI